MFHRLPLAIAAFAFAAAPAAAAPKPFYPTTSAVNCTAIHGKPQRTNGKVSFPSGATGNIILSCPINLIEAINLGYSPHTDLIFRDSTGTGTGASVVVRFVAVDMTSGAKAATLLFSSDTVAIKTITRARSPLDAFFFNSSNKVYTFEIELKRNSTSQTVEAYGFELVP